MFEIWNTIFRDNAFFFVFCLIRCLGICSTVYKVRYLLVKVTEHFADGKWPEEYLR